ncbi:hypothetical protein [Nostoc sp.]|uniref:hypothetical protein n=1 Tax=Nostoc sp. TaxID=1180 RepID=UPI003FA53B41
MTRDMVFIHTCTDQEEVARLSQRYGFLAVSVVDREQRLVSIITIDNVIYIIQKQTTEDIYVLGGGVRSRDNNYFQINLLEIARQRVEKQCSDDKPLCVYAGSLLGGMLGNIATG